MATGLQSRAGVKYLLALVLASCAGGQHPTTRSDPTCDEVVEHMYQLWSGRLSHDEAIEFRDEFRDSREELAELCEANVLFDRQCVMVATDPVGAKACGRRSVLARSQ